MNEQKKAKWGWDGEMGAGNELMKIHLKIYRKKGNYL